MRKSGARFPNLNSMQHSRFLKRSLTGKSFFSLLQRTLRAIPFFLALGQKPKLPISFQEKIMLAVTSVNECKYCSYFHSKMAIEHGCVDEEVNAILSKDFKCMTPEELPALAFAQHFAESHETPSKEAIRSLLKQYGFQRTKQILAICIMITWGNLLGNTIDAYSARLANIPRSQEGWMFEALLYYSSIKIMKKLK